MLLPGILKQIKQFFVISVLFVTSNLLSCSASGHMDQAAICTEACYSTRKETEGRAAANTDSAGRQNVLRKGTYIEGRIVQVMQVDHLHVYIRTKSTLKVLLGYDCWLARHAMQASLLQAVSHDDGIDAQLQGCTLRVCLHYPQLELNSTFVRILVKGRLVFASCCTWGASLPQDAACPS